MIKNTEITLKHIRAMLELLSDLEGDDVTPDDIDYVLNLFGVKANGTGLKEVMVIAEMVNNIAGNGDGGSSTDPLKEFDASIVAISKMAGIKIDYSYPYLLFVSMIELIKEENKS